MWCWHPMTFFRTFTSVFIHWVGDVEWFVCICVCCLCHLLYQCAGLEKTWDSLTSLCSLSLNTRDAELPASGSISCEICAWPHVWWWPVCHNIEAGFPVTLALFFWTSCFSIDNSALMFCFPYSNSFLSFPALTKSTDHWTLPYLEGPQQHKHWTNHHGFCSPGPLPWPSLLMSLPVFVDLAMAGVCLLLPGT